MLGGVIPIHTLTAVIKVLFDQVPDPDRTITHGNRVAGSGPTAPAGFGPDRLAKYARSAQVRHVTITNGMRQVNPLTGGRVWGRFDFNFKHAPDFQFLPAFTADIDHAAVQAHPQVLRLADFPSHDLRPGRQGGGYRPPGRLDRLAAGAPDLEPAPNAAGGDWDMANPIQNLGRVFKLHQGAQPDGIFGNLFTPVPIPDFQLLIQGGKARSCRSHSSNNRVPGATALPGSRRYWPCGPYSASHPRRSDNSVPAPAAPPLALQ